MEVAAATQEEERAEVAAQSTPLEELSTQKVDTQFASLDTASPSITVQPPVSTHNDVPSSVIPSSAKTPSHSESATLEEAAESNDQLPSILPLSLPPPLPAVSARNSTQLLLNRSLSKSNQLATAINAAGTIENGLESVSTESAIVIGRDRRKEVIRIERDWSNGEEIVQFWGGWVWELEGRVRRIYYDRPRCQLTTLRGRCRRNCFKTRWNRLMRY